MTDRFATLVHLAVVGLVATGALVLALFNKIPGSAALAILSGLGGGSVAVAATVAGTSSPPADSNTPPAPPAPPAPAA